MNMIQNPVIPGFHPDPSICRVNDIYYLVTSSFEYFPGVPLFTSKNLKDWTLIGHCLTRNSQLPLNGCQNSEGIYAPTIRYHDGYFFMVTTNVSGGGNFIVHTQNPSGEWSEPAWVRQGGIDPSLLFVDDKTYFISNGDCKGNSGIYLCEINPFTGEMLTESTLISTGCGGKYPEAPHLYYINHEFYLMLAEGGTEYGHMVTMQKSTSPWGPFTPCPYNPILTNRNLPNGSDIIACTGHADLIDDIRGNWWMVALGVRTICTEGKNVLLHNLGRETYLTPVTWKNGYPMAGNNGVLQMNIPTSLPESIALEDTVKNPILSEEFSSDNWNLEFTHIRNPHLENYFLNSKDRCLVLKGCDSLCKSCVSPTFLGVRQNSFFQVAKVTISGIPENENSLAGLSVYYTNEHHYDFGITLRNGVRCLVLRRQIYDLIADTAIIPLPWETVDLQIESDKENYYFFYFTPSHEKIFLGQGTTAALCTEITRHMTFTGTFFGMFAEHMTASFQNFIRQALNIQAPKNREN